ncbi:MAG: hypothetical protein AAFR97_11440, partial [Bacteroidota bacterium]
MLILRIGKSRQATRLAIEQINGQATGLGTKLRTAHQALLDKLLYYYGKQLASVQSYGNWDHNSNTLPSLRTNNKQLSKALNCSTRTIINLRRRLKMAGLIAEEWRGSNSSYDLWLSLDLLHLETVGDPTNLAPAYLPPVKTLRHTVSCTVTRNTNKLNELSGGLSAQVTEDQILLQKSAVDKSSEAAQMAEKPQNIGRDTGSGYKASKAKPAAPTRDQRDTPAKKLRQKGTPQRELPDRLDVVMAHLPRADKHKLQRLSLFMWQAAKTSLYADAWLDERQEELGRIALAEYLAYSSPRLWKSGARQVADRIELVRRWIERRHKAGKKAFVPIPEVYFDFRNEKGFRVTKSWYLQHRLNLRRIKDQEILTKAVKEYLRSLEDGAAVGPQEALRRCLQRLGKRSPELAERFKEQIVNLAQ